jgi:hypothetical protein
VSFCEITQTAEAAESGRSEGLFQVDSADLPKVNQGIVHGARRSGPALVSVVVYCVAAAFLYRWIGAFSASRITSCACSDQVQEVWFLAWPAYALTHAHSLFFSNWIDYPSGINLGVNTSFPLLGLLAAPITLALGPVFSYNFLLWLAFPASATSMMFVLRRWTDWWPAAFAGGLLYGFSPYMVGQGWGHLHLVFVPVPPLILLTLHELLVRQLRSAPRTGILLGGLSAAQYLISSEIFTTVILMSAIGVAVLIFARPREIIGHWRHAATGLGYAVALCGIVLAYPIWFALAGPQHLVGLPHPPSSLRRYQGDLAAVLLPTLDERFAPNQLVAAGSSLTFGDVAENGLYLGLPLVLVLIGFTIALWKRRIVSFSAVMLLVAFVLALGPRLTYGNHATGIPLPWSLALRVPLLQEAVTARFSLYMQLFAAITLAVGLDSLRNQRMLNMPERHARVHPLSTGQWRWTAPAIAVGAFALVPLFPNTYPSVSASVPRLFTTAAVKLIPMGSTVLFYPYQQDPNLEGMLAEAETDMRFKIYGGFAFIPGPDGLTTYLAPTLEPPALQTLFFDALHGMRTSFGPRPPLGGKTVTAIRTLLVRYGVGTVVVERVGVDPALAVRFLTMAIGQPEKIGGVTVWFNAVSRALRGQPG